EGGERLAGGRSEGRPVHELVRERRVGRAHRVWPRVRLAGDADDVLERTGEHARHAHAPDAGTVLRVAMTRAVELGLAGDLEVDHRAERREQGREPLSPLSLERGERV